MRVSYNEGSIVFGNWKLTRLIGEGSYGKVYEAERTEFNMTYRSAVKIITIPQSIAELNNLRAEGMDQGSITTYFSSVVENIVKEVALMAKLEGTANVVSYKDHLTVPHDDKIGWDILIRMELLTPLLDYTINHVLTSDDVIKLGIDICKALEQCQRYNIIHRDVKPENIFLSDAGDYKLGDFGIARTFEEATSEMSKKGTYTYMAPEVYNQKPYNSSVDLYSLGIVMYRLLNENRTPFLPPYPAPITPKARSEAFEMRMSGISLPKPQNADGRLAEIILKACAFSAQDRYSSPVQMREELETIFSRQDKTGIICHDNEQIPQYSGEAIQSCTYNDQNKSVPVQAMKDREGTEETERTSIVFGHQEEREVDCKMKLDTWAKECP